MITSKHKTFVKHSCNVGPTSSMLVHHCTNIIQMFCVYWVGFYSDKIVDHGSHYRTVQTDQHITVLLCKAKRQYLLTCKVSRYCLLALHGRVKQGINHCPQGACIVFEYIVCVCLNVYRRQILTHKDVPRKNFLYSISYVSSMSALSVFFIHAAAEKVEYINLENWNHINQY